jgi:hypothetical protein
LLFCKGDPLIINSNDNLKSGRGNGTQCVGLGIKLKDGAVLSWKNWDGRRVRVSVDNIEHIECELVHKGEDGSTFNLKHEIGAVTVALKVMCRMQSIGGTKIAQFGVNSNTATTRHKLQRGPQGQLNGGIVFLHCSFPNWIYVVLSRVRSFIKGYFCVKNLVKVSHFQWQEVSLLKKKGWKKQRRVFAIGWNVEN